MVFLVILFFPVSPDRTSVAEQYIHRQQAQKHFGGQAGREENGGQKESQQYHPANDLFDILVYDLPPYTL